MQRDRSAGQLGTACTLARRRTGAIGPELRKGLTQDYVSGATKIRERRLRDIERKGHPFPRHQLVELVARELR